MNIINKVLNEQKNRQFNEDEIELLHFIFEREFKPPFRKGERDSDGHYLYYNRDNEIIGWLIISDKSLRFDLTLGIFFNLKYKVCTALELPDPIIWWNEIYRYIKYWIGNQIGVELNWVSLQK